MNASQAIFRKVYNVQGGILLLDSEDIFQIQPEGMAEDDPIGPAV